MAIQSREGAGVATEIGESILISGSLEGDEDLTVRGRVEGNVRLTRTLIVEASGVVKADVVVKDAVISGVVVGNVTASDSVQLTSEGRMVGDISAPRVIIVDGASFRGRVDMGDVDAERHEGAKSESRPALARPAGRGIPAPARSAQPARASSKETARAAAPPRPPASSSAPLPPLMAGSKKRVILKKGKR
jgi:cytoskeletal protein CcmA (bactofilin family)